jgi:hypothetical protein
MEEVRLLWTVDGQGRVGQLPGPVRLEFVDADCLSFPERLAPPQTEFAVRQLCHGDHNGSHVFVMHPQSPLN